MHRHRDVHKLGSPAVCGICGWIAEELHCLQSGEGKSCKERFPASCVWTAYPPFWYCLIPALETCIPCALAVHGLPP